MWSTIAFQWLPLLDQHLLQYFHRKLPANDGRNAQGALHVVGQAVNAGKQQALQRQRSQRPTIRSKTNVPEFGAGANSRNPVWGATGNPFDPTLIAGGKGRPCAPSFKEGRVSNCPSFLRQQSFRQ